MLRGRYATVALLCCFAVAALADENTHQYEKGEQVVLWLNKIGPYHNPQETYSYHSLPFCRPTQRLEPSRKSAGIGGVLEGNEFLNSDLDVRFRVDVPETELCRMRLSEEEVRKLKYATSNHYWYQMYMDELPIWGMIGEIVALEEELEKLEADQSKVHDIVENSYLYTHKSFHILYNNDRIIEVSLTSERAVEIVPNTDIVMSYSVRWEETDKSFENRFDRYLDYSFFEHQIHWFSIFNSFMMVLFLCGLVALILVRTIKNDYAKYMRDDDDLDAMDRAAGDDSGWKMVHGDVFRRPAHVMLHAALLGTGAQIVTMVFAVTLIAILRTLYVESGKLTSSVILVYSLSSIVNGYVSGGYYAQQFFPHPAPHWVRTMLLGSLLFPGIVFTIALMLNFLAMSYDTINALPIGVVVVMILLWGLVALPLSVAGTILGRHWNGRRRVPCRVSVLPRPISEKKWYTKPSVIIPLTGILPFGSIFIEMYFVFTSFWNYKFYYVYGFMLLVLVILVMVSVCVTIVGVYLLLNSEDYRWQWTSFLAAGSTAGYVFLYAIYYFFMKTHMSGLLQTCFYFGYMAMFCLGMFIMCGTVGYFGSSFFVRRIYGDLKID